MVETVKHFKIILLQENGETKNIWHLGKHLAFYRC